MATQATLTAQQAYTQQALLAAGCEYAATHAWVQASTDAECAAYLRELGIAPLRTTGKPAKPAAKPSADSEFAAGFKALLAQAYAEHGSKPANVAVACIVCGKPRHGVHSMGKHAGQHRVVHGACYPREAMPAWKQEWLAKRGK